MSFQNGFNGGLAGFQYLQDQQNMRRDQKRQDEGDAMQREAFGMKRQEFGEEQKQQQLTQLSQMARYLANLPPQSRAVAYQSMRPKLDPIAQSFGLPPAPEVWSEDHLPELQQLAQLGQSQQGATGVQGTYVDAQGNRVAIMRDGSTQVLGQNAPNNQIIAADGGYVGVNKGTLQAAPVMMGQEAPQSAPQDVMGGLMQMASVPGVTMTSGPRSPSHNAEVGGKPNSQHLAGTAGDYVVPEAQKAQFIALAKKGGFQAIDEGDHIHLQLPNGASIRGQLQPAAKAPPKAPAPTELERRVAMAREMGATPEQVKALVIGGGQTGNAQTVKTSQATQAKLAQFNTVQRQIDRLEKAAQSIANNPVFDGGPMDQYALKFLPQGQEMEQAAASVMPVLTALTRVPGVGAQSDLEARLAQLQLPSAEFPPEVNQRAIEGLRAYMADLKAAYENLNKPAPAPPQGGWSIQAVP